MVTEQVKGILANTNIDPLVVATVWNIPEQDCWEYLNDLQQTLQENDKNRDHTGITQGARDWAHSLPEAYETKRLLLLERLKNAKSEEEKKERLIHYKLFTNKLNSLPPEQIERARNYPIKQLIGTNKNITNCPFHDDKTASLNIKNNFYHCHGCGVTGDSIDFVMKRDGITFKEAVLKLT